MFQKCLEIFITPPFSQDSIFFCVSLFLYYNQLVRNQVGTLDLMSLMVKKVSVNVLNCILMSVYSEGSIYISYIDVSMCIYYMFIASWLIFSDGEVAIKKFKMF